MLQIMSYTFDHRLQGELLNRFPLPAIRDGDVRTSVRSRSTRSSRARHRSEGHENASFELLESLGDTLIASAIGKAVYHHIKHLDSASPAAFSAYRSLLQSNATLAQIALVYDFGARLEPPFPLTFAHRANLNDSARKTLGDAFEAHFGGLHIDGQSGAADLWLENVFSVLCKWADEQIRDLSGTRRGRNTPDDHLARFAAAKDPPPQAAPTACACWKRGLSLHVKEHGTRFQIQVTHSFKAQLDLAGDDGPTFVANAPTRKAAENETARLALLELDSEASRALRHSCGISAANNTDSAASGDGKSSSSTGQKRPRESTPGDATASKRIARA